MKIEVNAQHIYMLSQSNIIGGQKLELGPAKILGGSLSIHLNKLYKNIGGMGACSVYFIT